MHTLSSMALAQLSRDTLLLIYFLYTLDKADLALTKTSFFLCAFLRIFHRDCSRLLLNRFKILINVLVNHFEFDYPDVRVLIPVLVNRIP